MGQDSYAGPIAKLLNFTIAAYQENPAINLEVFVHKAEANTDEYRIGVLYNTICPALMKYSYERQRTSDISSNAFLTSYWTSLQSMNRYLSTST